MRGLGNDFKTAPLSAFDIVYEKMTEIVLFQGKDGRGQETVDMAFRVSYYNLTFPGESFPAIISGCFSRIFSCCLPKKGRMPGGYIEVRLKTRYFVVF